LAERSGTVAEEEKWEEGRRRRRRRRGIRVVGVKVEVVVEAEVTFGGYCDCCCCTRRFQRPWLLHVTLLYFLSLCVFVHRCPYQRRT